MTNNIPDFRNPQVAFENAIANRKLFRDYLGHCELEEPNAQYQDNYYYVGDWMYMHSDKTKKIDYFKNKLTRKYIEVSYD